VKTQIVYETNADYEATIQRLTKSELVIGDNTCKGLFWFRIEGTKTVFILSPYGKLQVRWNEVQEKKVLLKIVKKLLVPKDGDKLRIKPTSQQAFVRYPPPENFKLYWCDEETEYVRIVDTAKKESSIFTFIIFGVMGFFGFLTAQGLGKEALPLLANQTGLESAVMKTMIQITPYLMLVPVISFTSIVIVSKLKPSFFNRY
jgi:hypothetical protein